MCEVSVNRLQPMRALALAAAIALASCGGGGSSSAPNPAQSAASATPMLATPAATTLSVPANGGYSGALTFPMSPIAFAQIIGVSSAAGGCSAGGSTSVFCITMTSSIETTTPGFPALSLTLPAGAPRTGYAVSLFDPTQPARGLQATRTSESVVTGTVTVTGNTLTTSGSTTAFTMQAHVAYVIVVSLVATTPPTPLPSATPTPVPSAKPTATPTAKPTATPTATPAASPTPVPTATPTPGALVATPSTLSFIALGQTAVFAVSQAQYSGTFTAASSDTSVASITTKDHLSFSVTALAAGTATITVGGAGNQTTTVQVTVTTTGFTVN